jgi:hypothetical protein
MVSSLHIVSALAIACFISATQMPTTAAAQDQQSPQYRARELFQDGVTLAKAERWPEALLAFRRSAEFVRRPSTSYNIANALYRLDRPVEGLAELERYESMSEVLSSSAARRRGAELRSLLESAVAWVRLAITPGDAEAFIDDRPIKATGPDRTIRLNPGSHLLRVTHDEYRTSTRQLDLELGSRQAFTIALHPRPPVAAPAIKLAPSSVAIDGTELGSAPVEPAPDDRRRFVKRPGFWVMIGAIAAVGVGAGLAIGLTRRNDAPPCGTTGTCATTQGLTISSF